MYKTPHDRYLYKKRGELAADVSTMSRIYVYYKCLRVYDSTLLIAYSISKDKHRCHQQFSVSRIK